MGEKKGDKKAKAKEAEEQAQQARLQELKNLKLAYPANCKKYLADPAPVILKKIDKSVQGVEDVDKIIISGGSMGLSDIFSVTSTFENYNALSFLCLWSVKLDARGLEQWTNMIIAHSGIKVLHFVNCGIDTAMTEHIATICRFSKAVETLVIDHNSIKSSGGSAIFAGIIDNAMAPLRKLSLRYCDIGTSASEDIAATLNSRALLAELDLSGNRLGDEGIIPIARSLATNLTLKVLNLAANNVVDRDKGQQAGTITGVLKVLDINTQVIVKAPVTAAITAVGLMCASLATENNGLTLLDLRGNHVGQRGGECILEMLKARRQLAANKRAEPLQVLVTERMSGDMYEEIMDLNDVMDDLAKKFAKKGGGKKGKKK